MSDDELEMSQLVDCSRKYCGKDWLRQNSTSLIGIVGNYYFVFVNHVLIKIISFNNRLFPAILTYIFNEKH